MWGEIKAAGVVAIIIPNDYSRKLRIKGWEGQDRQCKFNIGAKNTGRKKWVNESEKWYGYRC